MGVSYNRLWKMLIDKNMKRIEMQYLTGISGNILARMGKNQYVSMENKSRHVKLLKLEECFRSRKKKLKKDNTPDTA